MPPLLSCPLCDGGTTDLLSGRELQIVGVQWEDGRAAAPTPQPILEER
jgi:hydrogenase nickel incorporation protein HypA/HybF